MIGSYVIGTLVQMNAAFAVSGLSADPTTVAGEVKDPSGVITTPAIARDATGNYHMTFTTALAGVHYYRFTGAGAVVVAAEGAFVVLPSHF